MSWAILWQWLFEMTLDSPMKTYMSSLVCLLIWSCMFCSVLFCYYYNIKWSDINSESLQSIFIIVIFMGNIIQPNRGYQWHIQTHPQASPSLPSTPSGPVAKSPLVHSPLVVANPGDLVPKTEEKAEKAPEVDNIYRKRVTWPGFWGVLDWLRA